ncbi:radical SAM protein [Pectinatus haikarae]|uniref:radical SAM protein n=1 Tax=Pectinatus haikarae TaxID=349096 RepID=UPI001E594A0E|nr:radical SAM protein [Pectinatus haikarae]
MKKAMGGVTLSGGEVLSQPEFAAALIQKLRDENIHIAVETSGYAPSDVFVHVVKNADLILFDLKHWDLGKHTEGTGVSNELPLANIKTAINMGKIVLPRIPVIPGYNDKTEDAVGFIGRLREVGAERVQLLPFHQYGQKKYKMLNRKYAYRNVSALHKEDLKDFQKQFIKNDIAAFF